MSVSPAQKQDALTPEQNPDLVQNRASDPLESVWVGASAGTGKTKVLTDRVLRLLLPRPDGAPGTWPSRLLCITFTKAAAAEMAIRINGELGKWATVPDDELRDRLEKLTGGKVGDDLMREARRLFARVVDTPGGMKILTIHAFCQSVLRRFPLEAGLPPHFDVMDDLSARETLRAAQEQTLETARRAPERPLGQAMARLTAAVTDPDKFTALMGEITGERSLLKRLIHTRGDGDPGAAQLIADVFNRVGANMAETDTDLIQAACRDSAFAGDDLRRAGDGLSAGSPTDVARSAALLDWLGSDMAARMAGIEDYFKIFLTAKGEPLKRMATKGAVDAMPDITDILNAEADRLVNLRERINALGVAQNTAALLRVGADILRHYEKRKRDAALLDYDDLIFTTLALLEQGEAAVQWVLYKLDEGLDHLLIDEAQDTNPEQWEIARRLCEAFWQGEGAREVNRTLFVVGDDKQSIYSFQRADPAKFVAMKDYFAARLEDMGRALKPVPMQISFRSTSAVLGLVDATFDGEAAEGVDFSGIPVRHHAWRAGQAGHIELWPPVCPPDPPPLMQWALPVAVAQELESGESARTKLAKGIAARIGEMVHNKEILASKNRPIRPRDILILVRSRSGNFVEQVVRALKSLRVPVSGVDRMVLTEQLAVMDMLCLADFLLLEGDDLSLATLLKSPLIGMDDDDLMHLAIGRGSASLWRRLLDADGEKYKAAAAYLKQLADHAVADRPYEFFARVLSAPCPADAVSGRRAVMARLGMDAIDPLDELLNKALDFEATHPPTLQGFTAWLRAGSSEIKRELEAGALDEVRIMTVHGAKGLQAPIVFLPDTMSPPIGHAQNRKTLLWPRAEDDVPLWSQRKDDDDPVYRTRREEADTRAAQEYRRLLYVALTRAEDRLYIGGWLDKKSKSPPAGCWYDLVAAGMNRLGEKVVDAPFKLAGADVLNHDGDIQHARIYDVDQSAAPEADKKPEWKPEGADKLPGWARTPPDGEPVPPKPLAPSKPAVAEQAVFSPLRRDDSDIRWKRGTLVHHLLQLLPDIAPDSREAACRAFLARPGHALAPAQQEAMAAETMRVLQHPEFAPIFGPGSLAEVPVSGLVGKGAAPSFSLSGQIDRLLVTEDEILIVDYKTNRPPPHEEENVSAAYLGQMAAYRAVISRIWPDRAVRCALLWTDGPFLMPLSDAILDKHAP